ncbi:MAG TPA: hypothetical protein VFQ44_20690 [Streptosporangiaceae bacterium]|nr:hypothetical protein [Streptosporangiaceae bacterium]
MTAQFCPASSSSARSVRRGGEQGGIGPADLFTTAQDGELRHGRERGSQFHEMPEAETLLRVWADEEHPAVGFQEAFRDQVAGDGLRGGPEHRQSVPPVAPQVLADAVFLETEGEKLLGDDVRGLGRWHDGLHPGSSPEQQQPGSCEQARLTGCQEEAISLRARSSSAAADSLKERRDGGWCVELDDPV